MCEMVSRFWFVCHFSVAGLSHEILARRRKCPVVDQSGRERSLVQEAHIPNNCWCFDAKTVTRTLVSTPAISEFPWIQRGVDLQCTVACCSRHIVQKFWSFNDCSRTESRFRRGKVLTSCCHLINNYCFRFSERQPGER